MNSTKLIKISHDKIKKFLVNGGCFRKRILKPADLLIILYVAEYNPELARTQTSCERVLRKLIWLQLTVCKKVDNLSFLRQKLNYFVLLVILTWSCVRSCSKILQKRLKRRDVLSSAREIGKESSLGQRVKNHGNCWLTSTKTQVWTKEKTL